ncbi:MAG: endonuclease/exonuclease/phosphatase family protein [Clostridiales bacterium]|nr:endonuclease/exonuclease/phosphatase family protein [Clostridiales bacterium]
MAKYDILTQNLRYDTSGENALERRGPRLLHILEKYAPDSIGFQEATPQWMDWLRGRLTGYVGVGVGRDNGRDKGEFSPVFYRADRFSLKDGGTFWLSETPDRVSGPAWNAACARICTWAALEDRQAGLFLHMNTHTDHVSVEAMCRGSELILSRLKALREKYGPIPAVVTGDFNGEEHSSVYAVMAASDSPVGDAKYLAGRQINACGSFHNFLKVDVSKHTPIDYIFLTPDALRAKTYQVVTDNPDGGYVSDHYAVFAELETK